MIHPGETFLLDKDGDIKTHIGKYPYNYAFQIQRHYDNIEPNDAPHILVMWNGTTWQKFVD